ncbi:hypothetical protein LEAN103870_06260 [Legionella anisa]|uniref:DUF1036 domain-containing protein n=1 Tax=Legionella anisa TaxID=28082 RepID=A0AAX0WRH5_9GAMM|nr:hypothetical protein [Legionella anisa]KTC76364.1 hypothetical protein Lani_0437 [Legionella anisa]PNL60513.1 hypothetical protein A6J39_004430 [Legionella anisa]UAK80721.1 hypothetical protein K8O89_06735 [Legionella anisa]
MDVLSRVIVHHRKFKKNVWVALCSFTLMNSLTHANTSCPSLNINAMCVQGAWQVMITPNDAHWVLMGESVNGIPCTSNEQTDDVRWNYAFTSARLGIAGCNYGLFDKQLKQIGLIQIKSSQYTRTGSNWEQGSYPGNWTCRESQEACLFR